MIKILKMKIQELVYQKGKFDLNRSVLEEIQKKNLMIINLEKWLV